MTGAITVFFVTILIGMLFLAVLVWFFFRRRKNSGRTQFVSTGAGSSYVAVPDNDFDNDDGYVDGSYFGSAESDEGETAATGSVLAESASASFVPDAATGGEATGEPSPVYDSSSSYDSGASYDSGSSDSGSSSSND